MTNRLTIESKNWENQTYQEWIKRVKKELKLEDLSDKVLHIDKDVIYDPYRDYSQTSQALKIKIYPQQSVGFCFKPKDVISFNTQMMKLLAYDLRVIRLELDGVLDWKAMMDGIHMNLLTWIIDAPENVYNSFNEFVSDHHKNTKIIYTDDLRENSDTTSLSFIGDQKYTGIDIINKLIERARETYASRIYLEVKIGQSLLHTIPFLRAARIAIESKFPNKKLVISAFPMIDLIDEDSNQQIIMAGSVAMQCSMSGVDFLFPTSSRASNAETSRLMLNIQNIMELESYTQNVDDPLSGSYVIDDITQQYLDAVIS